MEDIHVRGLKSFVRVRKLVFLVDRTLAHQYGSCARRRLVHLDARAAQTARIVSACHVLARFFGSAALQTAFISYLLTFHDLSFAKPILGVFRTTRELDAMALLVFAAA